MIKLKTFYKQPKLKFGDYLLFQEYIPVLDGGKYVISKPKLVIYLGFFVTETLDVRQALGFDYVEWGNNNRDYNEVRKVENHIEGTDYIDILGHWKNKPSWRDIIKSYRNQNIKEAVDSDEIDTIELR